MLWDKESLKTVTVFNIGYISNKYSTFKQIINEFIHKD